MVGTLGSPPQRGRCQGSILGCRGKGTTLGGSTEVTNPSSPAQRSVPLPAPSGEIYRLSRRSETKATAPGPTGLAGRRGHPSPALLLPHGPTWVSRAPTRASPPGAAASPQGSGLRGLRVHDVSSSCAPRGGSWEPVSAWKWLASVRRALHPSRRWEGSPAPPPCSRHGEGALLGRPAGCCRQGFSGARGAAPEQGRGGEQEERAHGAHGARSSPRKAPGQGRAVPGPGQCRRTSPDPAFLGAGSAGRARRSGEGAEGGSCPGASGGSSPAIAPRARWVLQPPKGGREEQQDLFLAGCGYPRTEQAPSPCPLRGKTREVGCAGHPDVPSPARGAGSSCARGGPSARRRGHRCSVRSGTWNAGAGEGACGEARLELLCPLGLAEAVCWRVQWDSGSLRVLGVLVWQSWEQGPLLQVPVAWSPLIPAEP